MKRKIALVTGGYSGEAVISYKSATAIYNSLDKTKYDTYLIDISNEGWFYKVDDSTKVEIDKNDFSIIVNNEKIKFDFALISLHGTPGEDGKLQGYFDCINLPYSTCDAATSALTFNKRYTVAVAAFAGVAVAKSLHLFKNNTNHSQEILKELQLPLFVKPNNGGSSLGMSKVMQAEELDAALNKAFKEDDQVLVEEFIEGREVTIGIFKNKGLITPLPITEIISKNVFFDFEAKYLGASEEITPAAISEAMAEKVRATSKKIYEVFNCKGLVRIDFIYDAKRDEPIMLEINTVPGQTEASLVPQQVRSMGMTLKEFYSILIEECFRK